MRAGQAIVQFVRCLQTQQHYAIKFFASYAVFEDERDLYRNCCRGQFMPAVLEFVSNQDGSFRDSRGNPMPPCFVMEKGESLAQRMTRCKNDMFTLVQVRPRSLRVAQRLAQHLQVGSHFWPKVCATTAWHTCCTGIPVTRSCQSPIWIWLANSEHLHIHQHIPRQSQFRTRAVLGSVYMHVRLRIRIVSPRLQPSFSLHSPRSAWLQKSEGTKPQCEKYSYDDVLTKSPCN